MTQTNEELREKTAKNLSLNASLTDLFFNCFPSLNVDELFELVEAVKLVTDRYVRIPQPEQFKVEIVEHPIVGARTILYEIKSVGNQNINFLDKFYLKQEALDFCKRFNLKVVEV